MRSASTGHEINPALFLWAESGIGLGMEDGASSGGGGGGGGRKGETVVSGRTSCGYCRSPGYTCISHGLWAHSLTVDDYQDGFPIPLLPNLNALAENTVTTGVSDAMPCPSTPVTRDKGKIPVGNLPREVIDFVEEMLNDRETAISLPLVENQGGLCFSRPTAVSAEGVLSEQQASQLHVDFPSDACLYPIAVEGLESGENQGIDLNETPQQKPKRKKHRPKVIREGKSVRTPKPKTPKPVTPKQATYTDKPNGKRKYVRKTNLYSLNTASPAVGKVVEPVGRRGMKPVRRTLNFDTEGTEVRDNIPGLASMFKCNAESQAQGACVMGTTISSSTKSNVQLTRGPEVVVDSQTAISFDLNQSANHILNEYTSFPHKPTQNHQPSRRKMAGKNQVRDAYIGMPALQTPPPQPSRRQLIRENLNNLAAENDSIKVFQDSGGSLLDVLVTGSKRNNRFVDDAPPLQLSRRQLIRENLNNLAAENDSIKVFQDSGGSLSDVLVTGPKRDHRFVDDARASAHANIMYAYNDIIQVNKCHDLSHDSHLGETCKKRRTHQQTKFASNDSSVTSSSVTSAPSKSWNSHQIVPHSSTFADAQRLMAQRKLLTAETMLLFGQVEGMTNNGYTESVRAHYSTSMCDSMNCNQKSIPENLPSGSDDREENGTYGIPACMEPIVADRQEKMEPKTRRKKGHAQLVNSFPSDTNMTSAQEYGALSCNHSPAEYKPVRTSPTGARNIDKKNSNPHIVECQSRNNFQKSLNACFSPQSIAPYEVSVDDIIQKLQHLDINKAHEDATSEAQNALMLYNEGVKSMIPFGGQLVHVKKRRPRVKVDLDPETHRVWKFLMGKESNDGDDSMDKSKEKWWEEERRVFHGRANSFIARMHLVQGDRRFSQWKGSVVDSVVGVFLTQNVSDHLSSSAFMALAAKFPLRSRVNSKESNIDKMNKSVYKQDGGILLSSDAPKYCRKIPGEEFAAGGPNLVYESQNSIGKEIQDSSSIQCGNSGNRVDYFEGRDMMFSCGELKMGSGSLYNRSHELMCSRTNTPVTVTGGTSYVEAEDRRSAEDINSSQSSVVSSQNSSEHPVQTADLVGLSSELSSEAALIMENMFNAMESSTSFTKLLEMANDRILPTEYFSEIYQVASNMTRSDLGWLDYPEGFPSMLTSSSVHRAQQNFMGQACVPSASHHLHNTFNPRLVELQCVDAVRERSISNVPSSAVLSATHDISATVGTCGSSTESTTEATGQQELLSLKTKQFIDLHASMSKPENCTGTHCLRNESISREVTGASLCKNNSHIPLQSQDGLAVKFQQNERKPDSEGENTQPVVEVQAQMSGCKTYQMLPKSNRAQTPKVAEPVANLNSEVYQAPKVDTETDNNATKRKKVRAETEKKNTFDWESLRRQACSNSTRKERSSDTMDSVDWEAVWQADVNVISDTIRERGMNNMLAERIKGFLNRLVTDHGSIDLEWLRDTPPDKVKDYLLSIRGLGLKSVECVRLLTLHHLAFPVDTNVGRICVRLGWVPLQPLPESLQLHLLELYPVLETIQKYLWPRLCTLDQRTLYELHYQMITFGKVFCTKSKPNCNACPMRGECKHFASAFASARLALPGPEEKSLVCSTISTNSASGSNVASHLVPLAQLEGRTTSQEEVFKICEPIVEEPTSPEPECVETSESAIEDAFFEDPDEIPTIKLNLDTFTQNLQNYMQANNMEIQDGDLSRALVLLSSAAASIPMPKLKNVSRLRTEHLVYELPNSHPLLEGLDQREPDDPCPYLLAIWAPGETAQSTEPPNKCCNFQETDRLCDQQTCFTCNSKREAETQIVRGTLLIPCRTAMRGSFPLNGTYFQVNEVFADHDSSHNPIDVPRESIWNLPRRTVYFGTSIPTIFKGLPTEGIQHCFWKGFVCVRGFDRTRRAPKPLYARLHFPASKAHRNKRTATNRNE